MCIKFLALFLLYLGTAKIGLLFDAVGGFASLIWPPSGIAFFFLLLFGPRLGVAVFLAAFVVNLTNGAPIWAAMGIALGNSLEPLVGTYLFKRFAHNRITLTRVYDVLIFVLVAAFSATISASFGTLSLQFHGILETISLAWPAWFLGDLISILIFTPFILVWRHPLSLPPKKFKGTEAVVLIILVIFITTMVFTQKGVMYWRPYWVHLLLIWATLRFSQHATTAFMLLIFVITVWCTALGLGPFIYGSMGESLFALQLFLASMCLTGLFFGAINKEREAALQARSDFVSIASHELKTPLTVLDIQMQLLRHTSDPAIMKTVAETMDFHLRRLNKLVASLLDLSKLESGKYLFDVEDVDLTKLMEVVAQNFQEYSKREKCELILNLEEAIHVEGNQYRLEQVLTNLLMNAIKYGAGKPIRLSLKRLDHKVVMTVEDQGMGIEEENLERIFDRFERVNSSKNTQGLGLGLYIAKEIVVAHKGRIWVDSELGKGSVFSVELPV